MSSAPLVSCIMIFLDGETFMMEAIRSILDQTYDHWELLLVDDGSTDRSTAMARDVAERHPGRVRYLEHDGHRNLGMSASRNVGIANASGKYLAFLDADDVWLPDKLRAQVTVLEAHPDAGMVYGPTEYWYSWTGKAGDRKRDLRTDIGTVSKGLVEPPALLAQVLRNDGATMPAICSLLVRRDTVEAVGRFESAFRGPYEDQAFLVKVFLKCPVFVTNECLDRYRQHPNSCCARTTETGEYHPSRPHAARHVFLRWLREYLAAEGVTDPGVWGALKRALKPYRFFFVHRASAPVRRALAPLAGAIKAPLRGVPRAALPAPPRGLASRAFSPVIPPTCEAGCSRSGTPRTPVGSAATG